MPKSSRFIIKKLVVDFDGRAGDPRDPGVPRGRTLSSPPFNGVATEEELVRIRSRDFH